MGHRADPRAPRTRLDAATAKSVAATLQALATPSRLLILATLREGPQTVGDLVAAVRMEQPAVSHQLRLLRTLGLVNSERQGRHIVYSLFDDHVAELIDQASAISPGLESPTVSPLRDSGWVAVRVMVPSGDMNQVMDELYALGARAILVSAIHAARI